MHDTIASVNDVIHGRYLLALIHFEIYENAL